LLVEGIKNIAKKIYENDLSVDKITESLVNEEING
jgi:hypothetical protein